MIDTSDIARNMDNNQPGRVMTIKQATGMLVDRASCKSENSIVKPALQVELSIRNFISGLSELNTVRESAEELVDTADDTLSLICAILECAEPNRIEFYGNEITPINVTACVNAAHKLSTIIGSWESGNSTANALKEAAVEFASLSHNIYRTAVIFETHAGSGHMVKTANVDNISEAFTRALLESVSSGSIAIRPAILGSGKKPSGKKRWYLQYSIQR